MSCICNHDLGRHPPDPQRPFAWPCRDCGCTTYREKADPWPIYILDAAAQEPTMLFARVHRRNNGRFIVIEGLTNR